MAFKDRDRVRFKECSSFHRLSLIPLDHIYTLSITEIPRGYSYELKANDKFNSRVSITRDELDDLELIPDEEFIVGFKNGDKVTIKDYDAIGGSRLLNSDSNFDENTVHTIEVSDRTEGDPHIYFNGDDYLYLSVIDDQPYTELVPEEKTTGLTLKEALCVMVDGKRVRAIDAYWNEEYAYYSKSKGFMYFLDEEADTQATIALDVDLMYEIVSDRITLQAGTYTVDDLLKEIEKLKGE